VKQLKEMKTKTLNKNNCLPNVFLIITLLLSSNTLSAHILSKPATGLMTSLTLQNREIDGLRIGKTCLLGLFESIPLHFCRKRAALGVIPNPSKTNFKEEMTCPDGMYLLANLCYRNCNMIGMENCGEGACSFNSDGCVSSFIATKTDRGFNEEITTYLSLGSSNRATFAAQTSAKKAVMTSLMKLDKGFFKNALVQVKMMFRGKLKDVILKKAKEKVNQKLKQAIKYKVQNMLVSKICDKVFEKVIIKITTESKPESINSIVDSIDVFEVKGNIKSCSNREKDGGVDCASGVVESLNAFNPTSLLIIATIRSKVCDL